MSEQLSPEKIKEMIRYWIEVHHIRSGIYDLLEDTDEVGEYYEFEKWLSYDQTGDGTSVMDVHAILSSAYDKCHSITEVLDNGLEALLLICRQQLPDIFGKYARQVDDHMIKMIAEEILDTAIGDIYDYQMDKQYEKFCGIVKEICGRIIGANP